MVSKSVRESKGKTYGSVMLSDGDGALTFDCDPALVARLDALGEYQCVVSFTEEQFGDKMYNRRKLCDVRAVGK